MKLGRLYAIHAPDFDLALTLDSGQVFHWEKSGAGFLGAIDGRAVYVEQHGEILKVREGKAPSPTGQRPVLPRVVARYFALDHPLAAICASLPNDRAMTAAKDYCRGLRIIRQPRWECLATFITSSMKQVAHIVQMSHAIRRAFGRRVETRGIEMFVYPPPERLAQASEEELRACKLGYRAKNLLGAARM